MTIFLSPVVSSYFPLLMYHKEQELIDLTLLSYFFFFLVLGVKPALLHAKYTLYPVMALI